MTPLIRPTANPADITPEARYQGVQDAAAALLAPLLKLMAPGAAKIAIADPRPAVTGPIGNELCARFESCVRPLLLAAHWLHSLGHVPRPEQEPTRQKLAGWFRSALLLGTDPNDANYWGPDANYYQLHVDMGLLCLAFQMARRDLWDPFSAGQKAQIARWLGTARGAGLVHANHYFMGVHILEFLGQEGFEHRMDRPLIDNFFRRMEAWHHGNGWFEDGANQSFDYYNAYAFHYYGLWWARLYADHQPARARRWLEWTRLFLSDYEHLFAASGENVPFGRSLPYRFNAIAVFGLAALEGVGDAPLGRIRRLCLRNLDFFPAASAPSARLIPKVDAPSSTTSRPGPPKGARPRDWRHALHRSGKWTHPPNSPLQKGDNRVQRGLFPSKPAAPGFEFSADLGHALR